VGHFLKAEGGRLKAEGCVAGEAKGKTMSSTNYFLSTDYTDYTD
jgi:hypothetical protein